jgi:hypothetical protein
MGVDQAGNQDVSGQIDFMFRLDLSGGVGAGQNGLNATAGDGDGVIFQDAVVGAHRDDPLRMDEKVCSLELVCFCHASVSPRVRVRG